VARCRNSSLLYKFPLLCRSSLLLILLTNNVTHQRKPSVSSNHLALCEYLLSNPQHQVSNLTIFLFHSTLTFHFPLPSSRRAVASYAFGLPATLDRANHVSPSLTELNQVFHSGPFLSFILKRLLFCRQVLTWCSSAGKQSLTMCKIAPNASRDDKGTSQSPTSVLSHSFPIFPLLSTPKQIRQLECSHPDHHPLSLSAGLPKADRYTREERPLAHLHANGTAMTSHRTYPLPLPQRSRMVILDCSKVYVSPAHSSILLVALSLARYTAIPSTRLPH